MAPGPGGAATARSTGSSGATPIVEKDLLCAHALSTTELNELLDLASRMRDAEFRAHHSLRGATVACVYDRPSLRTRVSFQAAAFRLGLLPILVGTDELRLGHDEPIAESARALSDYCEAIVAELGEHVIVEHLAKAADVPVINAGSDEHKPCQALADLLTLRDRHGALAGVRLAYVGALDGVACSLIEASAIAGMHVAVAAPDRSRRLRVLVDESHRKAATRGGSVTAFDHVGDALSGADAVYAGIEAEAPDDLCSREPLFVTRELMGVARPNATLLRCASARSAPAIESGLTDDRRAAIREQTANRLCVEEAVLQMWLRRARGVQS